MADAFCSSARERSIKTCFHLIILMHDPLTLVLSSNDISVYNMFAVLDVCNLIISSVASDVYEERENMKLSISGAGFVLLFVCFGFFIPSSVNMLESKTSEGR